MEIVQGEIPPYGIKETLAVNCYSPDLPLLSSLDPPPASYPFTGLFVVEIPISVPRDMSGNHDVPIGDASAGQSKKSHNRKRNKNRHPSSIVNEDNYIREVFAHMM